MKVLDYLSYVDAKMKDLDNLTDTCDEIDDFIIENGFVRPEPFFFQKFEPKLIEEYFNIKKDKYDFVLIKDKFGSLISSFYFQVDESFYEFSTSQTMWELPYPLTLNDFITDCNRLGIELEFKEVK